MKGKYFLYFKNLAVGNKHVIVLFFFIFLYIAYFTTASFLRHDNFYSGLYDLGNMDQAVWNTFRGRVFQVTNTNGDGNISRLSGHADFILIILSPLYYIWSSPKTLLLVQAISLGIGAFFVYKIGQDLTKDKNISLAFSIAYLFNPFLGFTSLYDFHPVALAPTFLLASFYFLKRSTLLFALFLVLAGITKEQVWIIVALLSLYFSFYYFKEKNYKKMTVGILIVSVSLFIFYLLIWKIIPANNIDNKHFALSFYSEFGDSPSAIVKNIILSPKSFNTFLTKERLGYIINMLSPVGLLPILSPFYLIFSLPDFLINLLSNNSNLRQIYFHYTANITPFVFVSAIAGVKRLLRKFYKIPRSFVIIYLLGATFVSAYVFGPLPFSRNPNTDMFTKPQENKEFINKFLMRIPKRYSVAATNNLGAHLSHRQKIYTIPEGLDKANLIIFLLNDQFAQPSLPGQKEMVRQLENDKNYLKILKIGDFVAFRKKGLPSWGMNFDNKIFF